jgi:hypothetical protein
MAHDIFMGGQISNYATWDSHMQVMIVSAIRYNHIMLSPPYHCLNQNLPSKDTFLLSCKISEFCENSCHQNVSTDVKYDDWRKYHTSNISQKNKDFLTISYQYRIQWPFSKQCTHQKFDYTGSSSTPSPLRYSFSTKMKPEEAVEFSCHAPYDNAGFEDCQRLYYH